MFNPIKPYYIYRPDILLSRLARTLAPPKQPEQTVRLPWGMFIRVNTEELVGNGIWRTGVFEMAVSEALWRLTQSGDTVLDVGANIGYTTSILSQRVGSGGLVHSFEPHPRIFGKLKYNAALFNESTRTDNICLHETAASDSDGVGALDAGDVFASNEGTAALVSGKVSGDKVSGGSVVDVETRRLDTLFETAKFRVMKVDVEGHEAAVFRGAERLLAAQAIENIVYEEHGDKSSESHQILLRHGYSIFSLNWRFGGPYLGPLEQPPQDTFDAPNYVATRSRESVAATFAKPGWQIL